VNDIGFLSISLVRISYVTRRSNYQGNPWVFGNKWTKYSQFGWYRGNSSRPYRGRDFFFDNSARYEPGL